MNNKIISTAVALSLGIYFFVWLLFFYLPFDEKPMVWGTYALMLSMIFVYPRRLKIVAFILAGLIPFLEMLWNWIFGFGIHGTVFYELGKETAYFIFCGLFPGVLLYLSKVWQRR